MRESVRTLQQLRQLLAIEIRLSCVLEAELAPQTATRVLPQGMRLLLLILHPSSDDSRKRFSCVYPGELRGALRAK